MKKIIAIALTLIVVSIIVSSCTSGQRCAAYGERSRYQIERH